MDAAGAAVSGIVAAGILPSAIEMMDRLTIEAAEHAVRARLSGRRGRRAARRARRRRRAGRGRRSPRSSAICVECGAFEIRAATSDAERALLWKGRKSAFAAMGRIATDYYVQDGVVPRTRLPEVLRRIEELSERARPARRQRLPRRRRQPPSARALRRARGRRDRAGARARRGDPRRLPRRGRLAHRRARRRDGQGVLDAAHVLRARPRAMFERLRRAFDPPGICNPGKVIPTPRLCGEVPGPVPACTRSRGSALPSVSSLEEASVAARGGARAKGGSVRIGVDLDAPTGSNRILEHEAGDLTCTVEAGVRLSALRAALADARPAARRSTRPATRRSARCSPANVSGPLRHRFGAPRDLVLGVTLVLADGTIANAGGKVVKNVAGYDLGDSSAAPKDGSRSSRASASACTRCRRRRARSLSRRTTRRRSPARSSLAAPAERARRPPPRPRGGAVRGLRARGRRRSSRRRRRSSAAGGGRRGLGRVAAAPGRRARAACASRRASSRRRSAQLDEAVVRPAAGVAYVSEPVTQELDTARPPRLVERDPRASSTRRECSPRDPRVHRRLRPLRVLPADVPDVRALERGDGLAARAHPPDGRAPRRHDRAQRDGRRSTSTAASAAWPASRRARRACATTG